MRRKTKNRAGSNMTAPKLLPMKEATEPLRRASMARKPQPI